MADILGDVFSYLRFASISALLAQFPILETALLSLGVVVWPMIEFEADDALASAAAKDCA